MAVVTKRERFNIYNGLVCLLQGIEGKFTTVDLRNESCITGKIEQVDAYMNIVMSEAVFIDTRGFEFSFDSFFIHARNIRYVHIPDEVAIVPTITNQLQKMSRKQDTKSDRPSTFREKKLEKRQKETLKLVEQMKKDKESDAKK